MNFNLNSLVELKNIYLSSIYLDKVVLMLLIIDINIAHLLVFGIT